MKKINVELNDGVMYSNGSGEEIAGNFIVVKAPTGQIAHHVALIKTEIGKATRNSLADLKSLQSENSSEISKVNKEDNDPISLGDTLLTVMNMGDADMPKVYLAFKEILKESALLADEKTMTLPLINRMSFNDLEKTLKEYLGNFIPAS